MGMSLLILERSETITIILMGISLPRKLGNIKEYLFRLRKKNDKYK